MDSYISKLNSIPFIIYLEAPIIPNLTRESPFDLCPFYVAVSYCEHTLTFWHDRMPQAHPCDSLPQLWSQPFLRGVLIYSLGKWYLESKILALDVPIPIEMLLLPGRAKDYKFTHTHTHTAYPLIPHARLLFPKPLKSPSFPWQAVTSQDRPPSLGMSSHHLGADLLWATVNSDLALLHPPDSRAESFRKGKERRPPLALVEKTYLVNNPLHIGSTCVSPIK